MTTTTEKTLTQRSAAYWRELGRDDADADAARGLPYTPLIVRYGADLAGLPACAVAVASTWFDEGYVTRLEERAWRR